MSQVLPVRTEPITLPNGTTRLTVVDRTGSLVDPVERYVEYLVATNSSTNTVRSYARHLALFFRWLAERVRGHEKVPTGGQVAVPTGGHLGSPVVAR